MHNPLNVRYTSIRRAKKAYKKYVGEDFPRWYLYKNWFMRFIRKPLCELPDRWKWLKESKMKDDFEKSFAISFLYWDEGTYNKFKEHGNSLF